MAIKLRRNSNRRPKNDRDIEALKQRKRVISERAQLQFENALRMSGFPVKIYNRLERGKPCSCTRLNKDTIPEDYLDANGELNVAQMNDLLSDGAFSITS